MFVGQRLPSEDCHCSHRLSVTRGPDSPGTENESVMGRPVARSHVNSQSRPSAPCSRTASHSTEPMVRGSSNSACSQPVPSTGPSALSDWTIVARRRTSSASTRIGSGRPVRTIHPTPPFAPMVSVKRSGSPWRTMMTEPSAPTVQSCNTLPEPRLARMVAVTPPTPANAWDPPIHSRDLARTGRANSGMPSRRFGRKTDGGPAGAGAEPPPQATISRATASAMRCRSVMGARSVGL